MSDCDAAPRVARYSSIGMLEVATAKVSGATIVLGGAQAEVRASWWEQQQARLDAELVRAAAAALRR